MSFRALDQSFIELLTNMSFNNGFDNHKQTQLIDELMQGWNLAKQLHAQMGQQVFGQTELMLLDGILASFNNSLRLLESDTSSMEQLQQHLNPTQLDATDFSKKRKMMYSWTKKEKVSAENGAEPDDGHSWRKYGQKNILGAKHPRSYYRCTYRKMQGCCAMKQVQRSDDDPLVFNIIRKGRHTCSLLPRSKSAPTLPHQGGPNKQPEFTNTDHPQQQQPNALFDFQTGLNIVDTLNLDNKEIGFPGSESGYDNHPFLQSTSNIDNSFYSSYSTSFVLSPATTSESAYFSSWPLSNMWSDHNTESDIADLISPITSTTNSPIITTDFSLDELEFRHCFPYDSQTSSPSFTQPKE